MQIFQKFCCNILCFFPNVTVACRIELNYIEISCSFCPSPWPQQNLETQIALNLIWLITAVPSIWLYFYQYEFAIRTLQFFAMHASWYWTKNSCRDKYCCCIWHIFYFETYTRRMVANDRIRKVMLENNVDVPLPASMAIPKCECQKCKGEYDEYIYNYNIAE